MSNRIAAEGLVACLRAMGHIEAVDEAQVAAVLSLAGSVDSEPTNAALWGQYRAAEMQLRGVTDRGKESAFESLLKELGAGDAVVSDTEVAESSDARVAGRQGGSGVGVAVDGAPAVDRGRRRGVAS